MTKTVDGRVVSFSKEQGTGIVELADGSSLGFDIQSCVPGVPSIGTSVDVELGTGYKGRTRVVGVTPAKTRPWSGIAVEEAISEHRALCVNPSTGEVLSIAWASTPKLRPGSTFLGSVTEINTFGRFELVPDGSTFVITSAAPSDIPRDDRIRLEAEVARLREPIDRPLRERDSAPIVLLERRPTKFAYLSDGGVAEANYPSESAPCALCKQSPSRAYVLEHEGSNLPTGEDVLVCDVCAIAGKVRFFAAEDFVNHTNVKASLFKSRASRAKAIADKLNRTPTLVVQLQGKDWPVCCNEPTDYVGAPANHSSFRAFAQKAQQHEFGRLGVVGDLGTLAESEPERWQDVCCFLCVDCNRRYFTFQPT